MLSQKALLACLNISQWTGRKLDKKATGHVQTTFLTDSRVGNYTKKLLPGASELEEIQTQAGAIRKFYYEQTLPWMSDGSRIISSKNYLNFVNEFRNKKQRFDAAVDEFLKVYPTLQANAQSKLGALYNGSEYPDMHALKALFQCNVSFLPLPEVQDFRTEVLDSEKDAFIAKMREVENQAMRDCWTRLHSVVAKAADKLNQPNAVFRDTLFENISEICSLLPKLNITDDPNLETARVEVESLIAGISPDRVRVNPTERDAAAKQLADITSRMGAFMGQLGGAQ